MDPKKIKEIIELLPDILLYVVPGAIFLYIFYFICSREISKETEKYFLLKSIIISFIIKSLLELTKVGFLQKKLVIIALAIISAYIISKFVMSTCFKKIIKCLGINKSFHHNIWNDIVDLKLGMWIKVYLLEEVVYYGAFKKYEEKDKDYMIFLNKYNSYKYDGTPINNFSDKKEYWVAVNSKDISRIEIFYNKNSEII